MNNNIECEASCQGPRPGLTWAYFCFLQDNLIRTHFHTASSDKLEYKITSKIPISVRCMEQKQKAKHRHAF